jgi:hypothetical protein
MEKISERKIFSLVGFLVFQIKNEKTLFEGVFKPDVLRDFLN